jgi:dihydrofolate synthase / folylpolyglutamate synthase
MVSVITPISYDHMLYLGDTLAAIAAEKAGIIKPGVPVVSAPQSQQAQQVIEQIAAERGCPLTLVGRDWTWRNVSSSVHGQQFEVCECKSGLSNGQRPSTYCLSLLGRHQQENATTALAAVARLTSMGLDIPPDARYAGLEKTEWPGRLEILHQHPWVIVDGAHNGDSMQKLRAAIAELFPHKNLILILGASMDKDMDAMFDTILPAARHILLTQSHHPRAALAASLAERIAARAASRDNQDKEGTVTHIVSIEQALDAALQLAEQDDLICITGSLFVVADLRAAWLGRAGKPVPSD